MARLHPPPPGRTPRPIYVDLPAHARLVRIFNPDRHGTAALSFRSYGPLRRFDHHRGRGAAREPSVDAERAVYYASWSTNEAEAFSSCLVEVFGDTGIVELANRMVAMPALTRHLRLLDLRGRGAMRAGTIAAVAKCHHSQAQPWSRFFYESTDIYGRVDGLLYRNAHNDEPAVMLYERAVDSLVCPPGAVVRLDHPSLRPLLLSTMLANDLTF